MDASLSRYVQECEWCVQCNDDAKTSRIVQPNIILPPSRGILLMVYSPKKVVPKSMKFTMGYR